MGQDLRILLLDFSRTEASSKTFRVIKTDA